MPETSATIHYEKLQIHLHSCARGYPLYINVPTPYHTSVDEFATFHSECATFHNFLFAKTIFDNKFDIYVQRLDILM